MFDTFTLGSKSLVTSILMIFGTAAGTPHKERRDIEMRKLLRLPVLASEAALTEVRETRTLAAVHQKRGPM
jgi:hypothetical protein